MTPPLSGCRTMPPTPQLHTAQIATWSATSKRSLPPQVPLQRGPGSDLMRDHPRRRPFPGVGRKAGDELEYDGIEYAALPVNRAVAVDYLKLNDRATRNDYLSKAQECAHLLPDSDYGTMIRSGIAWVESDLSTWLRQMLPYEESSGRRRVNTDGTAICNETGAEESSAASWLCLHLCGDDASDARACRFVATPLPVAHAVESDGLRPNRIRRVTGKSRHSHLLSQRADPLVYQRLRA